MIINIDRVRNGQTLFETGIPIEALELSELESGSREIAIQVDADMVGQELHLKIRLEGTLNIVCSRCLEGYEYSLRDEMIKVYQFNAHIRNNEESGDFIALPLGTTEIDLSEDIRDMVILSMPMKPLCSESCRGLCPICGINLNHERCQCQKKGDDRLQALKQFITPKGG